MNKKICVNSALDNQTSAFPAMRKKLYARPAIEILSTSSASSLLSSSPGQGPWADAKPRKPDFNNNFWDDEMDDTGNAANEGVNWAGYQQNMSIW